MYDRNLRNCFVLEIFKYLRKYSEFLELLENQLNVALRFIVDVSIPRGLIRKFQYATKKNDRKRKNNVSVWNLTKICFCRDVKHRKNDILPICITGV